MSGNLKTCAATTQLSRQSTISLDGDRAADESYCLPRYLSVGQDGRCTMMIASHLLSQAKLGEQDASGSSPGAG